MFIKFHILRAVLTLFLYFTVVFVIVICVLFSHFYFSVKSPNMKYADVTYTQNGNIKKHTQKSIYC